MFESKKSYNKNDVIVLVLKLLLGLATVAAAVYAGIKIYEKIQTKRMLKLCECCDEDYFDDEDFCECDCDCCEEADEKLGETLAEVTENEINPTEEN